MQSTTRTVRPVVATAASTIAKAVKLASKAPAKVAKAPAKATKAPAKAPASIKAALAANNATAQPAQATSAQGAGANGMRAFSLHAAPKFAKYPEAGVTYVPAVALGLAVLKAHGGSATSAQVAAAVKEAHPTFTPAQVLDFTGKVKRRLRRKQWATVRNPQ